MSNNHKYTIGLEVTDVITGRHGVIVGYAMVTTGSRGYLVVLDYNGSNDSNKQLVYTEYGIRLRNTGVVERMIPVDNAPDMIRGGG